MFSIRTVASLILALAVLQLAQGALGVHLPLSMDAQRFSETKIGFVGAAFSGGFMAGAWLGPVYLARIGHIRVFAAAAALAVATILALHWSQGVLAWMVNRFAMGAAVSLMFVAGESWMNASTPAKERGHVIGFYQVCSKAALALGPFLAIGSPPTAPEPLMLAALIIALAMLPVCFTSRAQPEASPNARPLQVRGLFAIAPAAVIAAFAAGLINTGVMQLAPLYAEARFGHDAAAGFLSAAWVGGLITQWPAGRLSDRVDRRLVIAGLLLLSAAGAGAFAALDRQLPLLGAALVFGLWGAGALSFYGVAVAHIADRAGPGRIAGATSGLLYVWAAGSVIGPAALGMIVDAAGAVALFWYAAILAGLAAVAMLWRRGARAEPEAKSDFVNTPATSVAAAELAYGESEKGGSPRD